MKLSDTAQSILERAEELHDREVSGNANVYTLDMKLSYLKYFEHMTFVAFSIADMSKPRLAAEPLVEAQELLADMEDLLFDTQKLLTDLLVELPDPTPRG